MYRKTRHGLLHFIFLPKKISIDRIVGLQYLLQWNMTPLNKVMQYIFALKTYDVFGAEKKWFSSFSN